jgi:hypothetical protein
MTCILWHICSKEELWRQRNSYCCVSCNSEATVESSVFYAVHANSYVMQQQKNCWERFFLWGPCQGYVMRTGCHYDSLEKSVRRVEGWPKSLSQEKVCRNEKLVAKAGDSLGTQRKGNVHHQKPLPSSTAKTMIENASLCDSNLESVVTSCVLKCPINLIINPDLAYIHSSCANITSTELRLEP